MPEMDFLMGKELLISFSQSFKNNVQNKNVFNLRSIQSTGVKSGPTEQPTASINTDARKMSFATEDNILMMMN